MNGSGIINYQGSKAKLIDFISKGISNYVKEGDCILDIFSGSGAVSNALKTNYKVYANDSELYASIIADAILIPTVVPQEIIFKVSDFYNDNYRKLFNAQKKYMLVEDECIQKQDLEGILKLYKEYPTVWNFDNNKLNPKSLRDKKEFNLFTFYYATSYFGIIQAVEIDSLIYAIKMQPQRYRSTLYSCLFFAIKETVFAKDGHMAQPLDAEKYSSRLFNKRKRKVKNYFFKKLKENNLYDDCVFSNDNKSFNEEFSALLNKANVMKSVDLIYADPPYTDMQYSRYYHLLNIACKYDYPELTVTKNGYTKGLYTEGRYQSKLSQKSNAKEQIEILMEYCFQNNIKLALSYAYPQDTKKQAINRYTISIEELIDMAKKFFGVEYVQIKQIYYNHSNNRKSAVKKVIEYLIICGKPLFIEKKYSIQKLKAKINATKPSKVNAMYNSHIYWSQKAYNICSILIKELSEEGDIIFDPFMGSGVTVLESIKNDMNRIGIGCDVNEMPNFIVKTLLEGSYIYGLEGFIDDFKNKIESLERFYYTQCPKCNQMAVITNCVFDKPERTGSNIKIKVINFKCPHCNEKGTKIPDSCDYKLMNREYVCSNINNSKLIRNSKIAVGENDCIRDIFTNRNFYILDQIVEVINQYPHEFKNVLRYILMSVLHLCKITDKHSNSQWPLWIPKRDCVEKNIISILIKKCNGFKKAAKFVMDNYNKRNIVNEFKNLEENKCMLIQKGSQYISNEEIPEKSVSLIITDPPYLEQVMYSEYMQLYKPFIGLEYNLKDEIVVSSAPSRNKDKMNYFDLLAKVFDMCGHKLKINKYMCLYFHDSNLDTWNRLISILSNCGFKYVSQIHIKKTVTLKNIISPKKSLNGDSILFFINTGVRTKVLNGKESVEEIEINIVKQARFLIKQNGAMSTPELYDNGLMEILIQNGWLNKLSQKYNSLVEIFEKHLLWDKDISKWRTAN
ncbi:DNA methyltransferase [Clostridium tyrobutyricum]|uniref:DNA methyltransferase n=1 Tax=Clostridium tyrobutyricum TaxID=1519 RepID=UPI0011CA31CD|nr:DNA methyltransferase [Clostridium tyrobutyricum]